MDTPRRIACAALGAALLALFVSVAGVTGFADAAAHKIGKNLVVTKSIKKGAVTGVKVKDGSLTAADLAPGTIPVVGNGKAVMLAGCNCLNGGANSFSPLTASGVTGVNAFSLVVPVAVTIDDFHVGVPLQGPGQEVTFTFEYQPPNSVTTLHGALCTVSSGQSGCVATAPLSIPAGSSIYIQGHNGAGGAAGASVEAGYTMRVG